MSAHTPGPWTFESGDNYYISSPLLPREFPHRFKDDSTGHFVAYIGNHAPDFGEANARLISSAPDMYAVLKELAECSQYWSEYDVPLGIHDRIAAALAKARGQ